MCGIFGFIGNKQVEAASIVRLALCELEYRGYDSWGVATETANGLFIKKAIGKVSHADLNEFLGLKSRVAIGHSRWATHGKVTEQNSHPHYNHDKTIAVVHNGIIENHIELRMFLVQHLGVLEEMLFVSETDTEVIPHLIEYFIRCGKSFEEAFVEAGKMLEGRYAIVAMKHNEPCLLAIRNGSPIVIGQGEDAHYIASDVPAFLAHTKTVCYPRDRVLIKITPDEFIMRDLVSLQLITPIWNQILWDKTSATKEGYNHFMLKEIMEQPVTIAKAICQEKKKLLRFSKIMNAASTLFFIGCGTAAKMAQLGELYTSRIGRKLGRAFVGSEFATYEQFLNTESVLFAVSQSGETADVLEALRAGEAKGATILSLLNVMGSSVDRMSLETLFLNSGPEIAVASTKAATAQIAILILLAHTIGGLKDAGIELLQHVTQDLMRWVTPKLSDEIRGVAEKLSDARDIYIIGRGLNAPIALEAAIKIQEVSYIHAEGFPGGELKHGPIALITQGTPVIALMPNDETWRDMQSNVTEVKSRGAFIIGIGPKRDKLFDEWIETPDFGLASPIGSIIPIQLLAYHLALFCGNDPDKPRNLAKSVTVK